MFQVRHALRGNRDRKLGDVGFDTSIARMTTDSEEVTVKAAYAMACDPGLDHSSWIRDSIQKFRPAGRMNVRNAATATGSVGEPSTTWPVASSTV